MTVTCTVIIIIVNNLNNLCNIHLKGNDRILLYDNLVIHEYHLKMHSWDISELVEAGTKCLRLYDLYATVNTLSAVSSTEHKQCNQFCSS